MLFVKVGLSMDATDHRILIPLHCVTRVDLEDKGIPDAVFALNGYREEDVYYTSEKGFYFSIVDIDDLGM